MEIAPRFAPAYAELGAALVRVNRMTEAIAAFQKATALASNNPNFQVQLGYTYLQNGDRNQAIQAFRAALTIQPNHQPARQALETLLKP